MSHAPATVSETRPSFRAILVDKKIIDRWDAALREQLLAAICKELPYEFPPLASGFLGADVLKIDEPLFTPVGGFTIVDFTSIDVTECSFVEDVFCFIDFYSEGVLSLEENRSALVIYSQPYGSGIRNSQLCKIYRHSGNRTIRPLLVFEREPEGYFVSVPFRT